MFLWREGVLGGAGPQGLILLPCLTRGCRRTRPDGDKDNWDYRTLAQNLSSFTKLGKGQVNESTNFWRKKTATGESTAGCRCCCPNEEGRQNFFAGKVVDRRTNGN
jgi:hypothetical protein